MRAFLTILCAVPALLAPDGLAALQAKPKPQVSGVAGWGGRIRFDTWTPVTVEAFNPDKTVEGTIQVMWAYASIYQEVPLPRPASLEGRQGPAHVLPVTLPKGARQRFSFTLAAPRSGSPSVWAYLVSDTGRILAGSELKVSVPREDRRLVAVVGTDRPVGLDGEEVESVYVRPDQMPDDWRGYAALQGLVWTNANASAVRSKAQWEALRTWISSGGRLIVARGDAVGIDNTTLADLLPVTFRGVGTARLDGRTHAVMRTVVRGGTVRLASDDGVPLVVRALRDGGRSVFVAFDSTGDVLRRDPGGGADFWLPLLAAAPPQVDFNLELHETPPMVGDRDLAVAAYTIPGVAPPDMRGLFILILAFLAVVSPIDYFLLKRLRRLEWTWYSFPAYALLFTGLVVLIGAQFARWSAFQNELVLEDRYSGSTFTRSRSVTALLAPADVAFTFTGGHPASTNFTESDFMAAEGKESRDAWIAQPAGEVREWKLRRNATGIVAAERCGVTMGALDYAVTLRGPLEAEVSVTNGTGVTYRQAVLVADGAVYELGNLPPGSRTFRVGGTDTATRPAADGTRELLLRAIEGHPGFDNTRGAAEKLAAAALGEKAVPGGVAAGADIEPWLAEGGTVLLAWDRAAPPAVSFDPHPGVFSRLRLTRVFGRTEP